MTAVRALDDTAAANADIVLRYLRVFETQQTAELQHIVAEDVRVHGAGYHVQGAPTRKARSSPPASRTAG